MGRSVVEQSGKRGRGRLAVLAMMVLVGVGLVAEPASASELVLSPRLNREVTGPYSGRQNFQFGDGCSFVHQVVTGSYDVVQRRRDGRFRIDACVDIVDGEFEYDGTFTVRTPRGARVGGTAYGWYDGYQFELTLEVEWGTRRFSQAEGDIVLAGTWQNDPGVLGSGPTSGTLEGELERRLP